MRKYPQILGMYLIMDISDKLDLRLCIQQNFITNDSKCSSLSLIFGPKLLPETS